MASLHITGGKSLQGEITVAGNKNAVLPCLAASILTEEESIFENVPDIEDVKTTLAILEGLGAEIYRPEPHIVHVKPHNLQSFELDPSLVSKLRASILFLGPMLARLGKVSMRHPGGCIIGRRPVGTHFEAIHTLGGEIITDELNYQGTFSQRASNEVFLDEASVTATENILMLAAKLPGKTVILGAACEPHVVNLAEYLQAMGATVQGAGTNRIEIEGNPQLHGARHRISPDINEAGTFAIMAAATQSHLIIHQALKQDFHMIGIYLKSMGGEFSFHDDETLEIRPSQLHAPVNIKEIQTRPWPGYPTDLLSPLVVLATQAQGSTLFHEWMFENRLLFSDKLVTMGANVLVADPHRILVTGPTKLRGKVLTSPDIRAGIALVIAALAAEGKSVIKESQLIARGYQQLAARLSVLGADIQEQTDA